jgi:hypothetical protein
MRRQVAGLVCNEKGFFFMKDLYVSVDGRFAENLQVRDNVIFLQEMIGRCRHPVDRHLPESDHLPPFLRGPISEPSGKEIDKTPFRKPGRDPE